MVADQQQAAAPFDESHHGVHFRRTVALGGDLDHQHVALVERLVVDLIALQQPRHSVELAEIAVDSSIVVTGVHIREQLRFDEPRGVIRFGGRFPPGVAFDDHHSAALRVPTGFQ